MSTPPQTPGWSTLMDSSCASTGWALKAANAPSDKASRASKAWRGVAWGVMFRFTRDTSAS